MRKRCILLKKKVVTDRLLELVIEIRIRFNQVLIYKNNQIIRIQSCRDLTQSPLFDNERPLFESSYSPWISLTCFL